MKRNLFKRVKYVVYTMGLLGLFAFCSSNEQDPGIDKPDEPDTTAVVNKIIRIASYNLRLDTSNDGDKAWKYRKDMLKTVVRVNNFDIFGTQEGFLHQLNDILELKEYAYIGKGRDDGDEAGEHCAIFYKKKRFEVLDKGDFWYSETPDVPSKGWDATCCNRLCSWGKFKDKNTEEVFYVFNSHFDHQGTVACRESARMLLAKVKQITNNYPAFCTGDFNSQPIDEPINIIRTGGIVNDSRDITRKSPKGTEGTFHGYNLDGKTTSRIDYVFVTKGIQVLTYEVINDDIKYNKFASDHFPVLIEAEI
ncbi:endonuclease/exonuclease/phosphatase family protein [Parabacteroides pacaensis]|uniref:endonuclease/exonuclease/phosphatase family protein n=1 Tax=Parabacteroides pacaensis TaxID=2086575 RepID=UPI0018FEBCBF|nr:endonuclease/exonuclease/phosphatase family protein [Parabacteroides pacaensis]